MRWGAQLAVTHRIATASPVPAAPLEVVAAGSMAVADVLAGWTVAGRA